MNTVRWCEVHHQRTWSRFVCHLGDVYSCAVNLYVLKGNTDE